MLFKEGVTLDSFKSWQPCIPLISEYPQLIGDAFWITLEFEMLVSGDSRKVEYPEKNLSEQPEKIKRKRIMSYGVAFSSKLERNHTADAYQRLVQSLC